MRKKTERKSGFSPAIVRFFPIRSSGDARVCRLEGVVGLSRGRRVVLRHRVYVYVAGDGWGGYYESGQLEELHIRMEKKITVCKNMDG